MITCQKDEEVSKTNKYVLCTGLAVALAINFTAIHVAYGLDISKTH